MNKKDLKETAQAHLPDMALLGVGALSAKGLSDINKLETKIYDWNTKVESIAKSTDGPVTWETAQEIFDEYTNKGKEISRAKVIGIPAAKYLEIPHKINYLYNNLLKKRSKANDSLKAAEHYNLFVKKDNYTETFNHLIEKGLGDKTFLEAKKIQTALESPEFSSPDVKNILFKEKSSLKNKYESLLNAGHQQAAETYKASILGDSETIGEARRLGGALSISSTPDIYMSHILPKITAIRKVVRPATVGLLASGAILGTTKVLEKTSAEKKEIGANGALYTAGGALTSTFGVSKLMEKKRVGITYGTMPGIGEGHKSPGHALKKVLEADPRFKKTEIVMLERDRYGNTPSLKNNKVDILANSGIGYVLPDGGKWDWADRSIETHGVNAKNRNIRAKEVFGIQTDALAPNTKYYEVSSATINKNLRKKDTAILWGEHNDPHSDEINPSAKRRVILKSKFQPLIDKNTVESLYNSPEETNLDYLENHMQSKIKTVTDSAVKQDLIENLGKLNSLKSKKYITISGAGRGDFVAARATELSKKLKESGLDKDYFIIAARAGGKGDELEHYLKNDPNIVSLGFMDRDSYTKTQRNSKVHWGSSGASSLSEAALMKNIQALPSKWGHISGWVQPGSIAETEEQMGKSRSVFPNLDQWNKGGMATGIAHKKFYEANNSDDIIRLLKDENLYNSTLANSVSGADQHYKDILTAQKDIADKFNRRLNVIHGKRMLGGAALVAGGAALVYKGINKTKEKY